MFKKYLPLYLVVLVVASLAVINGCGSNATGGGGGATTPSNSGTSTSVSLSGTVNVPSGTTIARRSGIKDWICGLFMSDAWALTGQTPLANATVKAYNFFNNILIETTSTDAYGVYNLTNIPSGIDVIIIVEKTDVSGNKLRLSAVIPNVDQQTTVTGEVNAKTTLAAEQMATFLGQDLKVNLDDLTALLASAETTVNSTTEVDLIMGHGIISTGEIGSGLVPGDLVNGIISSTPTSTEMTAAIAKAVMQDIRDCCSTFGRLSSMETDSYINALNSTVTPEIYDLLTYYDSVESIIQSTTIPSLCVDVVNFATTEVGPFFDATSEAFRSYFEEVGTFETYRESLTDAIADVQTVVNLAATLDAGAYDISDGYDATLTGATASNVWLFSLWNGKTVTVTLEETSSLSTYEYTAVGGPKNLDMHGISETNDDTMGARMAGSLTDDDLVNPVSYSGHVIPTVSSGHKFSALRFVGTFESDEINVNGNLNMTNINQDNDHYPMPNNISFNGMFGTRKASFEGSMNIVMAPIGSGSSADMKIVSFSTDGALEGDNFLLDGHFDTAIYQNAYYPLPSHVYIDGGFSTPLVSFSGLLSVDLAGETLNGNTEIYPSHFIMSGIFSTRVLTLEGAIEGHCAVTVVNSTLHNHVQDLAMNGSIKPDIIGSHGKVTVNLSSQVINTPGGNKINTYPTYVAFEGAITTEVLRLSGKFSANLGVLHLPFNSQYYPTVDELNFDGSLTARGVSMSGKFDGKQKNYLADYYNGYNDYYYVASTPESMTFSGKISSCGVTIEAGNVSVTCFDKDLPGLPKNITITGCKILTPSITAEGDFSANMVVNKYSSSHWYPSPKTGAFSGMISDTTTGCTANGDFSMNVSNAETGLWPNIAGRFKGKITGPHLPVIQADISYSKPNRYQTLLHVFYGHGLNTLSGTILNTEDPPGTLPFTKRTDIDLTNQFGLRANWHFTYDYDAGGVADAGGTIKKSNGTTLATFGIFSSTLRVTYTDGYFETLI